MSTPQPPKKNRPSFPVPPATSDSGVVKPQEIEALLGSLGDAAPAPAAPSQEPDLQSWFEGMIDYLPGQSASTATGQGPAIQPHGRPEASPQPSKPPRPGRMEAWEVGNSIGPSKAVNLGPEAAGSNRKSAASMATTKDLGQLLQTSTQRPSAVQKREPMTGPVVSPDREQPAAVVPQPRAAANPRTPPPGVSASSAAAQIDTAERDAAVREQVLLELQRVPALASLPLHVIVEEGTVTIVGDLAGEYEKQLVSHFARKVKGVNEVIDLTRVRVAKSSATVTPSRPAPRKPARSTRTGGTSLSLTLRPAWIAGVAGLVVLAWAGLSFGKRDVDRIDVHPAQGRVVFGDIIPDGALITLHPVSPTLTVRPRATVRPDGTFQVATYGSNDGAPEGDCRVTIVWHKLVEIDGEPTAGPNLIPAPYSQPGTTDLRISLKAGSNELSPLQIHP